MSEDKIEAIGKISSGESKMDRADFQAEPSKERFDELVQQPVDPSKTQQVDTSHEMVKRPTLEQEVKNLQQQINAQIARNPADLAVQTQELLTKVRELKTKLEQPNVTIRKDFQNQLKNKLVHIDEKLKIALDQAGIEYPRTAEDPKMTNPIDRFLGFLTRGEAQLETLTSDVKGWGDNKATFNPATMLLVQIKVNQVQQELELFANMLNQALQGIKTLMNVQV